MIKDKILKIRLNNRLGQVEFGKVLGMTQDTIGRIERGQQEVDLKMLIGLATHFDVNLHELVTGEVLDRPNDARSAELETENRLMRELLNLNVAEKKIG